MSKHEIKVRFGKFEGGWEDDRTADVFVDGKDEGTIVGYREWRARSYTQQERIDHYVVDLDFAAGGVEFPTASFDVDEYGSPAAAKRAAKAWVAEQWAKRDGESE